MATCFCTIDKWIGMSMEDIRRMEDVRRDGVSVGLWVVLIEPCRCCTHPQEVTRRSAAAMSEYLRVTKTPAGIAHMGYQVSHGRYAFLLRYVRSTTLACCSA